MMADSDGGSQETAKDHADSAGCGGGIREAVKAFRGLSGSGR
jgi:hypothetical protein